MKLPCPSFAIVTLLGVSSAQAIGVVDAPPPTAAVVRQSAQPVAAAQADDSSSLRYGVISAVGSDRVEINSTWMRVVDGQTAVFRQGRAVSSNVLVKGQAVKFTLAPGDRTRTTLGVVYVQ